MPMQMCTLTKIRRALLGAAAGLACAPVAHAAMTLGPNGTGQVLLYPYYTVQASQSTLVSVVNTTARAKVVKVIFREALNGRATFEAQAYLGPRDTWTANLFAMDVNGATNLLSDDRSCSDLPRALSLPDGRGYDAFTRTAYSGANADTGPDGIQRTREGSFEIVELGEIKTGTPLAAAVASTTAPPACTGAATADLTVSLDAPGGGLYGTFAIVDAAQGTIMAGQATAIDGFSVLPLVGPAASSREYLTLGRTSTNPIDPVDALVPVDGRLVTMAYPRARAVDAVSALLMSESMFGDFIMDPQAGADADWVVNAPTKRHYADPALIGAQQPALAPFSAAFGRPRAGYACTPYDVDLYDREQRTIVVSPELIGTPPPNHRYAYGLCYSTDVFWFGRKLASEDGALSGSLDPTTGRSPVLGSRLSAWAAILDVRDAKHGAAQMTLGVGSIRSVLPAGVSGPALRGLPVIGFEATKYVNGNVTPGVLANYTSLVPLRSRTACVDIDGAGVDCP